MAAADALLQPSRYEAFSRTMMEAGLAETPVIANAASDVVRWRCEHSDTGLVDDDEFEQCLSFVDDEPQQAGLFPKSGRDYVLDNYTRSAVFDRIEAALVKWTSE